MIKRLIYGLVFGLFVGAIVAAGAVRGLGALAFADGAGGTLLQHLKEQRLHIDLKRDDRMFYFTTCGWMMWSWHVS